MPAPTDITVILPFYWPETTGHCQSFNSLVPHLVGAGWSARVVTSGGYYANTGAGLPRRELHEGVEIIRFATPRHSKNSVRSLLIQAASFGANALLRALFCRTRSLFCLTGPPLFFAAAALVARLRRIPLVIWAMDLHPDALVASGLLARDGAGDRIARRLAAFGYRSAARVFTLGPVMTRRIAALGVPTERFVEVHNWVPDSLHYVPPEENALRRELGLEGRFVVMYSGNMGMVHEFDTLLDAAERLLAELPRALFLLVGNGPKRAEIEAAVAARGLANVVVRNYVPFERLNESLSCADLAWISFRPGLEGVVAPGKAYAFLRVGAPLAICESRESDLTRILETGAEGITVRPGASDELADYIRELAGDGDRRGEARRRNLAWYRRNCGVARSGEEFVAGFAELLGT